MHAELFWRLREMDERYGRRCASYPACFAAISYPQSAAEQWPLQSDTARTHNMLSIQGRLRSVFVFNFFFVLISFLFKFLYRHSLEYAHLTNFKNFRKFANFCRAMLCKRGLSRHAVSVCLSVCASRSWILSKRINISSNFFHRLVAKPF